MGAQEVTTQTRVAPQRRALRAPINHDPASLVWARTKAGWTQSRLAAALGISKGHMSEIESGKRSATDERLDRIAELIDCPRAVLEAKARRK